MKNYTGIIVLESLINPEIVTDLSIISSEVSSNLGWHLFKVRVGEDEFARLAQALKSNEWYMHFWNDREVVAVFKDKVFKFDYDIKSSWGPVVKYGLSIGIPKEQLDFPIE